MLGRNGRYFVMVLGGCAAATAALVLGLWRYDVGPGAAVVARPPGVGSVYVERLAPQPASFEMVYVPGGTFQMGSPEEEAGREASEGPRHEVRIEPFWMGKYEVTGELVEAWLLEWEVVTEGRQDSLGLVITPAVKRAAEGAPCHIPYAPFCEWDRRQDHPAVTLTSYGAQEFCRWLSLRTGRLYRLPTEAEWEYACRAGTSSAYCFGDDAAKLGEYAWFAGNCDRPQAVGRKRPNAWGLYDMHGNVAEWVLDEWVLDYRSLDVLAGSGGWRPRVSHNRGVARGGDAESPAGELRSAARRDLPEWQEGNYNGTIFNGDTDPWRRPYVTGFRVISPVDQRATDNRAQSIPPPQYPTVMGN